MSPPREWPTIVTRDALWAVSVLRTADNICVAVLKTVEHECV